MKMLSNAELRILYQRRQFLKDFIQSISLQLTANMTENYDTLRKRINAVRHEISEIVEDPQFDTLVSEAEISHPQSFTFSPANTMVNVATTAKEILSYVDTTLGLYFTPKTKELSEDPEKKVKVFIGHGRNITVRNKVKDFIKDACKLEPLILEELPSEGMTIIEKLEKYGRIADYAILILTADDFDKEKGTPRARQNVIQELGWFQGVLGRNRTAILLQKDVEVASNIAGVVYFEFTDNNIEITFENVRKELTKVNLI